MDRDGNESVLQQELEDFYGQKAKGYKAEKAALSMMLDVREALEAGRFASRQMRPNGEPTVKQVMELVASKELDPPTAAMVNKDRLDEIKALTARSKEMVSKRLERYDDPKSSGAAIKVSAQGKAELRKLQKRLEGLDALDAYVALVEYADKQLREYTHFVDKVFDAQAAAKDWGRNQHPAALDEIMVQLRGYTDVFAPDLANDNSTLRGILVGANGTVGLQRLHEELESKVKDAQEKFLVEMDFLHNNRQGLSREQILADLKGGMDVSALTKALGGATQSSNKQLSLVATMVGMAKLRGRDLGQQFEEEVIAQQAALEKAGVKDHAFMTVLDAQGKTTMQTVQKIDDSYWQQARELNQAVQEAGDYIPGTGLTDADKQHNKDVYIARAERRDFNKAEIISDTGEVSDGEHHRYTEEFKKLRDHFQVLRQDGSFWNWGKRDGVDEQAYERFEAKYYGEEKMVTVMLKATDANGHRVLTGEVTERPMRFTNAKATTEIVEERHRNPRYATMLADTTPQGKAKLAYYNFYMGYMDKFVPMYPKEDGDNLRKGQVPAVMAKVLTQYNSKAPGWLDWMGRTVTNPLSALEGLLPAAEAGRQSLRTKEDGSLLKDVEKKYTGGFKDENKIKRLNYLLHTLDQRSPTYAQDELRLREGLTIEQNRPEPAQGETNLSKALLAFGKSAYNYEQLKEQEGTINLVRDALQNRTFYEEKGGEIILQDGKPIPKHNYSPQIVKQTSDWLDQNYFHDTGLGADRTEQLGRAFKQYVSITYQGLNYAAALKNLTAGNLTNRIYAHGRKFGWDHKIADKALGVLMKDGANVAADKLAERINGDGLKLHPKKSIVDALMEKYGLLEHSKDIHKASVLNDTAFALTTWGEYHIQSQIALCKLLTTELVGKDGKKAVVMNIHSLVNGQLRVDPNYAEAWDAIKHRVTLDIRNINKHISGNHSDQDKVALEKEWMGASVLQFHRWVHNGFKNRWGRSQFDEGIGITTEGYYRSLHRLAKAVMTFGLRASTYHNLSEHDKAGARMALAELSYAAGLLGLLLLVGYLKPEPDDDDKHLWYLAANMTERVLQGTQGEMTVFANPLEVYQLAKNPVAGLGMVRDLGVFLKNVAEVPFYGLTGHEDKLLYQSGTLKGTSKLKKSTLDLFPILRMKRITDQLETTGVVWIR